MSAFLLALHEVEQMIDLGNKLVVATQDLAGVVESHLGSVEQTVGFGEAVDHLEQRVSTEWLRSGGKPPRSS